MNQQVFQQAKVMGRSNGFSRSGVTTTARPGVNGILQRKCACGNHTVAGGECESCRQKRLQRAPLSQQGRGVGGEGVPPTVHDALHSPGQPLDSTMHGFMEPRFGHDFSGVRVHSDAGAVKVPSAPVNEFEDCPVDWLRKANAALVVARRWVANVVTGLANLPYPFPAPVANLLNRHFHITGRGYVYEVRRHYNTIYSALNSPIDFECEKKCDDNVAAYVYSVWSDVHLCPIWYGQTPAERANTIIHEIAHDAADRDDEAYIWEPKYGKLSVEDAIDNADSYSNFAQEAYGP